MTPERICKVDGCDTPLPTSDVGSTACPGCWNRLDQALGEMPALVAELDTTISRQNRSGDNGGPKGTDTPLPYNKVASDALTDLHGTLWAWTRDLAAKDRAKPPSHGASVVGLARYLLKRLHEIRHHPQGNEAIDEILSATRRCRRVIDRAPARKSLGKCLADPTGTGTHCQAELLCYPREAEARCQTCGTAWDVAIREQWLSELAQETLVTRAEGLAFIRRLGMEPAHSETISEWKRTNRLLIRGQTTTPNGRTVEQFRMGDLIDLHAGRPHR